MCFRLKDWGAALTNYQKVLTALGEDETAARADVYHQLGCIKREQGQAKQAINNFEKSLSVDSAYRPTLEALVSLYTELKDWKQVVAYKRQILDNVFEADERFRMLNEIADVWSDQDKAPLSAIEALEEARELQPLNPGLLHKLIALYQATENWSKMIDTLQAIAENEKDAEPQDEVPLHDGAALSRQGGRSGPRGGALRRSARSEPAVPRGVRAHQQDPHVEEGLQGARAGVPQDAPPDVHGERLEPGPRVQPLAQPRPHLSRPPEGHGERASRPSRWRRASSRDEVVERQILAELYEATDQTEAAVGEHSLVLQKDPLRVDPYRSLYKLYLRGHEYDRAWCMCAALAFLRKTDDEEQRFFEDYRPKGMIQVKSRLDNEGWVRSLFHKDENLFIGKIFEMLTPAAIVAKTNQLKAQKQLPVLDRRFRQDPATSTVTFAKTFGWAAQVLGVPTRSSMFATTCRVRSRRSPRLRRRRWPGSRCSPGSRRRS